MQRGRTHTFVGDEEKVHVPQRLEAHGLQPSDGENVLDAHALVEQESGHCAQADVKYSDQTFMSCAPRP